MKIFDEKITNEIELEQALSAFRISKTIFAAVDLNIFDWLEEKPADAAELGKKIGVGSESLARLLDACVGLGLLEKQNDIYRNTELSATYLCWSSEQTMNHNVQWANEISFPAWAGLEKAVADVIQPVSTSAVSDENAVRFQGRMIGSIQTTTAQILKEFDFSRFQKVADVGGGIGFFSISLCELYPQMSGEVFDTVLGKEKVLSFAEDFLEKSAVADKSKFKFTAGDYLKEHDFNFEKDGAVERGSEYQNDFPEGDLFVTSRVLHHHTDKEILKIMRRVWDKLPAGGAMLIVEPILNDVKDGSIRALLWSVNMLLSATQYKIRSFKEYLDLAQGIGFIEEARFENGGSGYDALLLRKA